jgi:plastocyanin
MGHRKESSMKDLRHLGPLLFLAPVVVALTSCGGAGGGSSSAATSTHAAAAAPSGAGEQGVSIRNFTFEPGTITVKTGARIMVSNRDSTAHTATSDAGSSFDTRSIDPGSSSTITLNRTGRVTYHCRIHPFMHGTIIVKGARRSS